MGLDRSTEVEKIGADVLAAALRVHTALGAGLLEGAYEVCLADDLERDGRRVERQVALPIEYYGRHIEAGYRVDLLVERQVIVEIKAVERLAPVHIAQLITYLRFGKCALGYLLNFNVQHMRQGIKRVVV